MSHREFYLSTVTYKVTAGVATITLNRPKQINAFNIEMRDDLYTILELYRDDQNALSAVLCGSGDKGFCSGADLSEFGKAPSQIIARSVRWERDLWGLFLSLRKPIVVALHGYVVGSGVEISSLCDVRIAAENTTFRMPEAALGLLPAAGGTQMIPRLIGQKRAMKMLLMGEEIDVQEARRSCLIDRIVPNEALMEESLQVATELTFIASSKIAIVKELVRKGLDLPADRALDLERMVGIKAHFTK